MAPSGFLRASEELKSNRLTAWNGRAARRGLHARVVLEEQGMRHDADRRRGAFQ